MDKTIPSDSDLLSKWTNKHQESAFHALVARYAGLVHSVAKRTCGDDALATEASQLTFILLARKAKSLTSRNSLAGWLHLTAVLQAKSLIRSHRRESRKCERLHQSMETSTHSSDSWREIQPVLDDAIAALSENDREAILLRFYRSLTIREIGETLGIATDAAQKRIDRATERLRGKLAKRGCQAGGTLAATMVAGFAADAQAAVPAVSLLAAKAIAAAGVSIGFAPATVGFFTISMKPITLIPPLLALTVSATWIGLRRNVLAGLESDGRTLVSSLAVARTGGPTVANSQRSVIAGDPHDPKALLMRASGFFLRGGVREADRYFASVPKEKILAAMDEISRLEPQDRARTEELLAMELIRADSAFALEHLVLRTADRRQGMTSHLASALKKWAAEDPLIAAAWFDRHLDRGTFASKRLDGHSEKRAIFESSLLGGLLTADPELGAARLSALPEHRRTSIVDSYVNEPFDKDKRVEITKLVRNLLPPLSFSRMLVEQTSRVASNEGLAEASEFLTRVEAIPEERAACVEAAARSGLIRTSHRNKITTKEVDAMRAWVGTEAPDAMDRATGAALGQLVESPVSTISDITALAVVYHERSGNDDVLYAFLSTWGMKRRPTESRILAEKIADNKLRTEILRNLK